MNFSSESTFAVFSKYINDVITFYDFKVPALFYEDNSEWVVVDGEEGDYGIINYRDIHGVIVMQYVCFGGDREESNVNKKYIDEMYKEQITDFLDKAISQYMDNTEILYYPFFDNNLNIKKLEVWYSDFANGNFDKSYSYIFNGIITTPDGRRFAVTHGFKSKERFLQIVGDNINYISVNHN